MNSNKLAHTVWECKFHVVWIPKCRRKVVYGKLRMEIDRILRKLCEYKGVEIVEAQAGTDHIHMCLSIPPKYEENDRHEDNQEPDTRNPFEGCQ